MASNSNVWWSGLGDWGVWLFFPWSPYGVVVILGAWWGGVVGCSGVVVFFEYCPDGLTPASDVSLFVFSFVLCMVGFWGMGSGAVGA